METLTSLLPRPVERSVAPAHRPIPVDRLPLSDPHELAAPDPETGPSSLPPVLIGPSEVEPLRESDDRAAAFRVIDDLNCGRGGYGFGGRGRSGATPEHDGRPRQIVQPLALSNEAAAWLFWAPGLGLTWRCHMTTTPTTEVAVVDPVFSDVERYALAAFLAGYRGLTRDAYALDLRQFMMWCEEHDVRLLRARRADIERFARDLEDRGRARSTVARRLCTVAGFYRYAEQEGLLERSPAAHVRRPRLDYQSHATGLDRNEVGALLVAAGLASAREHALVSLLAINGLRVSEALGADIEALGIERGHLTPNPHGAPQGGKGRHRPARAAHGPSDRPGHRRTG